MSSANPSDVTVLRTLTNAISRAHDADAIYGAALTALEHGLGVRRASILLFDPDRVMRFKAWRGISDAYRHAVEGHTPWTPETTDAETIVVADVTADTGLAPFMATIKAEGIGAMVFVPLRAAKGVIGKFMLYFDAPRGLPESEAMLAAVIADQVAFAVQRVRAEQAARDRERELRLVTDVAPIYIAHCDRAGRYKFVNLPFAARFGLKPHQVIGRTILDVLGAAAYERVREHVDAVLAGNAVEFELEVPYERLGRRTVHGKYVPELDGEGQVCGFVAAIVDVTDARHALRASEKLFRQLADSLPHMVWIAGPDGHPEYYNERCYEFAGLDRETDVEFWKAIIHPDDQPRTDLAWRASVRTGEPLETEYRLRDRSGGYRWHLGRALPVQDDDGRIVRWFGTGTDIDDQKRVEQASRFLSEASRTLSALVDYPSALQAVAELAVPDFADWCAVDILDADGELRRLALSYWNPAHLERARELARRYPPREHDVYGPKQVMRRGTSLLIADITDEIVVGSAHDEEHLAVLRAAGLKSLIAVPLKSGLRVIGAITFVTSGSGRRYGAAEQALAEELAYRAGTAIENARLYGDLQRGDRQKDEFLAVLAHELRNPLAPIRTALQLIRLAPDDAARRDRACDVMDRQVQQMVRLVDDLLDVSRITRGRIELQKAPVELAAVIRDAVETSRPLIESAGHALTVTVPPETITLHADATRIAQVFSNLLNNAAKYTPRGGQVAISAERSGAQAVVRVRDTGIGIPPAMLTGIFDMFTQVDRSLEKTHGGLGIGLTLAKRLVEMHGGRLEAHSEGDGRGSEFAVWLPAHPIKRTARAAAERRPDDRGPAAVVRRILVVDDNRDAADSLAEMLRIKGHDVATAHDGLAALNVATEFHADTVLLDLGMPKMSGYATARRLRTQLPTGVVLIAVTGWGQEEHRRRSREAGFDHHLVKPVDPVELDALLATAVARRDAR